MTCVARLIATTSIGRRGFTLRMSGRNVAEAIHMVAEIGCVSRHEAPVSHAMGFAGSVIVEGD
jgi:hypothetical protein